MDLVGSKMLEKPLRSLQRGASTLVALLLLAGFAIVWSACSTDQLTPTQSLQATLTRPLPTPTAQAIVVSEKIRPAAVAGTFYPDDPADAQALLDRFLAPVQPLDGTPIALIVPHAGWVYSGHVAAYAFKQIEGLSYDAIVIVAPNHTDPAFDAISVYSQGAFETPFGAVRIDEPLAAEILSANERFVFDAKVHEREHSIEVQLPFLQRVCPDCAFVPILIGQPTSENIEALSEALVDVLRDKRALVIASSDLSHYPKYDDALKVDSTSLVAMETMDDEMVSAVMKAQMAHGIPGLVTCACGEGPIVVAMRVAKALGADHVQVLRYANSGDVGGDRSRVVGYGAVMFWRWQAPEVSHSMRNELLTIARASLEEHFATGEQSDLDLPSDPVLRRRLGAFVTLTLEGELRGCIGRMHRDTPLFQMVAQAVVDAAVHDPRFPPLPADQLEEVEIEISVLSPLKRVFDVHDENEIVVGRHGLLLLYGQEKGVLLPQVPVAQGWDRSQYLQEICFKAGLPADCWEQATLYTFTADVFSESEAH
jgi:AmmeMemoRadiSam system protein B/AmmeMemoRadiSam system protein A